MSDVKRWRCRANAIESGPTPRPGYGKEIVLSEDYDTLKADRDRLREALRRVSKEVRGGDEANITLLRINSIATRALTTEAEETG